MREVNVDRMLRRMPWGMFREWVAYRQLEPYGDDREDWRHAALSALLANLQRDPKSRPQPYAPQDFLLRFTQHAQRRRQSADEQWKNWLTILSDHKALLAQAKRKRQRVK